MIRVFGNRPPRALPRRFRRLRLLVLGCGDVGLRLAAAHARQARVFGVVRRDEAADAVRATGAVPLRADLDARPSLRRLAGLADRVLHLAPPPAAGTTDPRTARALAGLARPARVMVARGPARAARWVYVSTTGVYGDRGGALVDERSPPAPGSDRARRRVDAERRLRRAARGGRIALSVLRAPGIYAADRLPLERIRRGVPAIAAHEDAFSNHVHADDLARAAWAALLRAPNGRVFNAVDQDALKMGEWFDLVADAAGLARPPRLPRAQIAGQVSPAMLSFMAESRRVCGRRLAHELRLRLRYPSAAGFVASWRPPDPTGAALPVTPPSPGPAS